MDPRRRGRRDVGRPDSPHTRGWTLRIRLRPRAPLGFPSHAGMDPPQTAAHRPEDRIPRTRGDGPSARGMQPGRPTDSPHTRGWTLGLLAGRQVGGGFPAHAGMGPRSSCPQFSRNADSPHTRGWTQRVQVRPDPRVGFPAHAGMDPSTGGLPRRGQPGFPAHAGMDPAARAAENASSWIPRTRGDGPTIFVCLTHSLTDSPHTRGWTRPR